MNVVRHTVGALGMFAGPLALALQRARGAGVVLLYHRVAPGTDAAYSPLSPQEFRAHCEFIRSRFTVLPLAEIVARIRQGRSRRGCATVTFDDGYRDFLDYAYPILRDLRFPVTHFLVSDCLDGGLPPWTYRVNRLGACEIVDREAAFKTVGVMDRASRETWLADRERSAPSSWTQPTMLAREDVRRVDGNLVEWGSHTRSHAFLDRIERTERERELVDSRQDIERITGQRVRYLAYPNGYFDESVTSAVAAAGYDAAFTVGQTEVSRHSPLFALPRFDIGGHPHRMLPLELAGVVEMARRVRRLW